MNKLINTVMLCLALISFGSYATNPLEDGISYFNHKEYQKAESTLRPLADKGNATALFWLGVVEFRMGHQFQAGETLLQSAEAGDPWAMLAMSPKRNGYCGYLGWPCDDKWEDKAYETLHTLADQGNGNAMYTLFSYGEGPWWAKIPVLNEKKGGELAEKMVKAGWIFGFNTIPMELEKRVELLQYGVKMKYAPYMVLLYRIYTQELKSKKPEEVKYLLDEALSLGYLGGAYSLKYYYKDALPKIDTLSNYEKLSKADKEKFKKAYYYSLIVSKCDPRRNPISITVDEIDENGKLKIISLLTKEEEEEINKKVDEFVSTFKQNMFFHQGQDIGGLLNP